MGALVGKIQMSGINLGGYFFIFKIDLYDGNFLAKHSSGAVIVEEKKN